MGWQIVERIRDLFGGQSSTNDAPTTESDGDVSPTLYKCPNCETTYISEAMESCPECGGSVDRRPSAAELGIESDDE